MSVGSHVGRTPTREGEDYGVLLDPDDPRSRDVPWLPLLPPIGGAQAVVDWARSEPTVLMVLSLSLWLVLTGVLAAAGRTTAVRVVFLVASILSMVVLTWRLFVALVAAWMEQLPRSFGLGAIVTYYPYGMAVVGMAYHTALVFAPTGTWTAPLLAELGAPSVQSGADAWHGAYTSLYAAFITTFGVGFDGWGAKNLWSRFLVVYGVVTYGVTLANLVFAIAVSFVDERNDRARERRRAAAQGGR